MSVAYVIRNTMFVGISWLLFNAKFKWSLCLYPMLLQIHRKHSKIILQFTGFSEIIASFSLVLLLTDFTRGNENPCPLFIFPIVIVNMYNEQCTAFVCVLCSFQLCLKKRHQFAISFIQSSFNRVRSHSCFSFFPNDVMQSSKSIFIPFATFAKSSSLFT